MKAIIRKDFCTVVFVLFCFLSVLLYFGGTHIRGYFITDMITPVLLLIISTIIYKFPNIKNRRTYSIISIIGTYSLEIYVANVISMRAFAILIRNNESIGVVSKIFIYFIFVAIISLLLIQINSMIKKMIDGKKRVCK